jgi:hypothetical protein
MSTPVDRSSEVGAAVRPPGRAGGRRMMRRAGELGVVATLTDDAGPSMVRLRKRRRFCSTPGTHRIFQARRMAAFLGMPPRGIQRPCLPFRCGWSFSSLPVKKPRLAFPTPEESTTPPVAHADTARPAARLRLPPAFGRPSPAPRLSSECNPCPPSPPPCAPPQICLADQERVEMWALYLGGLSLVRAAAAGL